MNDRSAATALTLSIAAVERDTGLSKDTLRVWERRYGFPAPQRDPLGERAYTLSQVEKLRVLKRLLDAGHRPGRIVPLPVAELVSLAEHTVDQPQRGAAAVLGAAEIAAHLARIRSHDVPTLRNELMRLLARVGVARFVGEVLVPLNGAVGDAWIRGQLEIFEQQAYAESVQVLLRQAIAAIPAPAAAAAPRVLMTTFPGDPQGLELLMAEALLALDGCDCISLGTQTPLWDIVLATQAYGAQVVALNFSAALNPNPIIEGLMELRGKLPATVQLWAAGHAPALQRRPIEGVRTLATLDAWGTELQRWRQGEPLP